MIAKLHGTLIESDLKEGIIMTASGVGYRVCMTPKLLTLTPPTSVELYTYHHIREDTQMLYGFESAQEYQFFSLLLTVDGVGPKTAFTVISQLTPRDVHRAVVANDVSALTKVSGLGKKTAQKIILELSNKFKTGFDLEKVKEVEIDEEAVLALSALGYSKVDAKKMLEKVDPALSLTEKVTSALKK
jgi:Holliday junction DNA helicase RuvA